MRSTCARAFEGIFFATGSALVALGLVGASGAQQAPMCCQLRIEEKPPLVTSCPTKVTCKKPAQQPATLLSDCQSVKSEESFIAGGGCIEDAGHCQPGAGGFQPITPDIWICKVAKCKLPGDPDDPNKFSGIKCDWHRTGQKGMRSLIPICAGTPCP